ncbi:hypothetical protein NX059_007317 [Plenodomus lindquistii]|nr:hypothetical protein NX059_007317 [Plenodomus lindquistii]
MLEEGSIIDGEIMEPDLERGITRVMSDVLLGVSTPIEESEVPLTVGHENRDQASILCHDAIGDTKDTCHNVTSTQAPITKYPGLTIAALLRPYLDGSSWKSLRLANRAWYDALSAMRSCSIPAAHRLPLEILQSILLGLGPKDFNAARHTCRNWMLASLDLSLLNTMLNRGGWQSSARSSDLMTDEARAGYQPVAAESKLWTISRRVSRQCALSSGWTGNGLDDRSAFSENSHIDFDELSNGHASPASGAACGLIFSASLCGYFLCVARDTIIFVYDLQSGVLKPVTSVISPRRVLSMSMDVSSGRHAIAALLEGRMGMVCELQYGRKPTSVVTADRSIDSFLSSGKAPTKQTFSAISADSNSTNNNAQRRPPMQAQDRGSFHAIDVISNHQHIFLQEANDSRAHEQNLINDSWPEFHGPTSRQHLQKKSNSAACGHTIPLESGTSTFYRHLCSEDDPPRSVSICPQRRCVAFGCSAGIELHWIDALTGRGLNRWFPLTAPSDHLFFLSPRPGFESAKKLRLISSAAHPDERSSISRRFFSRPTVGSFWGSFGFESLTRRPGSPGCDHYHAVPLSDGYHVLYIDPATDHLTLGCDAPLGGPTKLLRKIVFLSPDKKSVPRMYAAAADMSQGALITVAFGDAIILYNIPPDVIGYSRSEQKPDNDETNNMPQSLSAERPRDHWLN